MEAIYCSKKRNINTGRLQFFSPSIKTNQMYKIYLPFFFFQSNFHLTLGCSVSETCSIERFFYSGFQLYRSLSFISLPFLAVRLDRLKFVDKIINGQSTKMQSWKKAHWHNGDSVWIDRRLFIFLLDQVVFFLFKNNKNRGPTEGIAFSTKKYF